MTLIANRDALERVALDFIEAEVGQSLPGMTDQAARFADTLLASGVVIDAGTLADEIAASFPLNGELRHDGSEDPQTAAYVEGLHDAWQIVRNAALAERSND